MPTRLIQISDTHLLKSANQTHKGVNTTSTLSSVIDLIYTEEKNIDALLITGDISEDGSIESYGRMKILLEKLSCPIYVIPGNHDNSAHLTHLLSKNIQRADTISFPSWEIIFLDSTVQNQVWGALSPESLQLLASQKNSLNKIVALHHHPHSVNTPIFENIGLKNATEFFDVLHTIPHVKAIVCGHVHQDFQAMTQGICFLSCPSTWIQVKTSSPSLQYNHTVFDRLAPGYRWINLLENGDLETGIKRIFPYDAWKHYE